MDKWFHPTLHDEYDYLYMPTTGAKNQQNTTKRTEYT